MQKLAAEMALGLLAATAACVGPGSAVRLQTGPIRQHPENPHYLLFRGQPVVLVTSGEHYGAVVNPDFNFRRYLSTLAADGLNYTRIFTGAYIESPGAFGIRNNTLAPDGARFLAPWGRSPIPGYRGGGNRFDLERWDEAYFNRLQDFMVAASELGIIVEVTLFSSYYGDFAGSPLHPDNHINGVAAPPDERQVQTLDNAGLLVHQERLVRKLVQELNGFDNVFFEIQNEPWADRPVTVMPINPFLLDWRNEWKNRVDLADEASLRWQQRIAEVIRDEESRLPNQHLIAQNFCNFRYPLGEVPPAVSILNFHYAYPEAVAWNYGLDRVIGFDESGFSGSSDEVYRTQAWSFLLSGGGIFNHLDYSFYVGAEDGRGQNQAPGGGSPELRRQLGVLSRYLHSFDFLRMRPDCGAVVHASHAVAYCLAEPGRQYAVYLRGRGPTELRLALPGGSYRAQWIAPETGSVLGAEDLVHPGGEAVLRSPTFEVDVALDLRGD